MRHAKENPHYPTFECRQGQNGHRVAGASNRIGRDPSNNFDAKFIIARFTVGIALYSVLEWRSNPSNWLPGVSVAHVQR